MSDKDRINSLITIVQEIAIATIIEPEATSIEFADTIIERLERLRDKELQQNVKSLNSL